MFDQPVFPWQEYVRGGTKARFKSKLRKEEQENFKQGRKTDFEKRVRSSHLKGVKEQIQYLGLSSQDVYDENGTVIKQSQNFVIDPDTDFTRRIGYNPMKLYSLARMGLEYLPRSTAQPRVTKDTDRATAMLQNKRISSSTLQVLKRTNYKAPLRLNVNEYDDDWPQRGRRARHLQVLITILNAAVMKSDFVTAWKVFPILIRFSEVDIRHYWTLGMELLNKKHGSHQTGLTFLDWLLVNHPSGRPTRKATWKLLPSSLELLPYFVMVKLAGGESSGACEKIDDLILSKPYSGDPTTWALYGIALLQSGDPKKARAKFERCEQLGGIIPQDIWRKCDPKVPSNTLTASDASSSESEGASEE